MVLMEENPLVKSHMEHQVELVPWKCRRLCYEQVRESAPQLLMIPLEWMKRLVVLHFVFDSLVVFVGDASFA
jgi:hypothetical protein